MRGARLREVRLLKIAAYAMTQKTPVPEYWWRQNICCTCEYWGGERELDFRNATLMYVQAQFNPPAKCAGARLNTIQFPTNRACHAYKRWHKLP